MLRQQTIVAAGRNQTEVAVISQTLLTLLISDAPRGLLQFTIKRRKDSPPPGDNQHRQGCRRRNDEDTQEVQEDGQAEVYIYHAFYSFQNKITPFLNAVE